MITHIPFNTLGNTDFGWLNANYHFSFANYYNKDRMGHPPLCVWNDDTIAPKKGFPKHPHQNMEIITYVRTGAITHEDSMGNKGRTEAGSIQVMSAGSGITHSEYNLEETPTTLFQIWVKPNVDNITPRWETKTFPKTTENTFVPFASGQKKHEALDISHLYQDATLWVCRAKKNTKVTLPLEKGRQLYGVLNTGAATIKEIELTERDGVYITDEETHTLNIIENSEMIIMDLPHNI